MAEKLFTAAKKNSHEQIKLLAEEGADINAKNAKNVTILHVAAWKGHLECVKVILQNKGDPNAVGMGGSRPIHYAAKFGHNAVVAELLSYGANYNQKTEKGKTPLDLCDNQYMTDFLKHIEYFFQSIGDVPSTLVADLNELPRLWMAKAIMNARNEHNQTLLQAAIIAGTLPIKDTVELFVDRTFLNNWNAALRSVPREMYEKAIQLLEESIKNRSEIFGPESPATLFIEEKIYTWTNKLGYYPKALLNFERMYEIQKRSLGEDCQMTLRTNTSRAFTLHLLGRDQEALCILKIVCEKLSHHYLETSIALDYANAQTYLGMVNHKLGFFREALASHQRAFKISRSPEGSKIFWLTALLIKLSHFGTIAGICIDVGRYEMARSILYLCFDLQSSAQGIGHSDTLRILRNIARSYSAEKNTSRAEIMFKSVLGLQKEHLGNDNVNTLSTQLDLALCLASNGKTAEAKEALNASLDKLIQFIGPNHPELADAIELSNKLN